MTIFRRIEQTVMDTIMDTPDRDKFLGRFKEYANESHWNYINLTDTDIFWRITYVLFFANRKAAVIEKKLDRIKNAFFSGDYTKINQLTQEQKKDIIDKLGHRDKCEQVFFNAIKFKEVIEQYGSFRDFILREVGAHDTNIDHLMLSKLNLTIRNKFIGGNLGKISVDHLLLDLGFDLIKPDRVWCRVMYRIGLIHSETDTDGAKTVGREWARENALPIRYVDIIVAKLGQEGASPYLGTAGICTKNNPRCDICRISDICP